jgi:hypothetical protein
MPLGIRPTVDFAFKKVFGSPENAPALIGLLNAILALPQPIVAVEIQNPFSYQEFAENKLVVLDMHRSQLRPGEDYAYLTSSISICLLGKVLFRDTDQPHHRFQMADLASGRTLDNAIEVHTVELTKYNLDEQTISRASKLEQWVFLLLRAQDYSADDLRRLLPDIEFVTAIDCLVVISQKTQDKTMYDQNEKARRDYEWGLSSSRKEGLEEGLEKGLEKGREEGKLVGQIQILESLSGDGVSSDDELRAFDTTVLASRVASLQQRLRDRNS